jgi:hypothetical protein
MTRTRNLTVGLVIAGLLGLFDLPSFLMSSDNSSDGPPLPVAILSTVLGLITLVALYFGWRGDRRALWTVVGSRIVSALLGLPAFFVDIPTGIKILVAVVIVLTVFAVWLIVSELRMSTSRPRV